MACPSVGISSTVAVFLLLTSVCCILSLSSTGDREWMRKLDGIEPIKVCRVRKYLSNFAMSFVILIGIVSMVVLIFKRNDLTTSGNEGKLTRRHYLHRKHSLRSIIFFFVPTSLLHFNYLVVEFCCVDRWTHCAHSTTNISEIVFHSACIIFVGCETIVCWIVQPLNFKRSQWVWHGVAVIQAANFAIWFDSLLKEAYHRIHENSDLFDSYFSLCNVTLPNHSGNHSEIWCTDSSIAAKWFVWSIPFLFPVTIEFALLVSETFLGKLIGGNDDEPSARPAAGPSNHLDAEADEETPLLQHSNENLNRAVLPLAYRNSCWSKIFILISVIINIAYCMLTILIFVGYKLSGNPGIESQLQTFDNVFTIYSVFYNVFSICCCLIGIVSSWQFKRPHPHTSFLEYLMLLATAGVLLQSMKRIVSFASNSDTPVFGFYLACGLLYLVQSLLQIVFYYFAKDVKLQPFNSGDQQADKASRVAVFRAILTAVSVTNLFIWISDSFLLPEILPGITPTNYVIEHWHVFDNAVTPITIFFRFNSVLMFWCLGTDVFTEGELHQD